MFKGNRNIRFKFEQMTTNYLYFIEKYYKNIMVVIIEIKDNLNIRFKFKLMTTNYLYFIKKYYKNILYLVFVLNGAVKL